MIQGASLKPRPTRNRTYDLVRIALSAMVLFSHGIEITDGDRSREPLARITGGSLTFGMVAVDIFFLLSGYLIVASWVYEPRFKDFFTKRILRIVPGYLVAFLLSVLVCGWFAPAVPRYFHALVSHQNLRHMVVSMLRLGGPQVPPVFPGNHRNDPNTSMWTLGYEFRCYMLVALFGVLGLLRKPWAWGVLTALWLVIFHLQHFLEAFEKSPVGLLTGNPSDAARLAFPFLLGGCFFLFKRLIPFRTSLAFGAAVVLVLCFAAKIDAELALIVCGGYLLFFMGNRLVLDHGVLRHMPDISYGMYVYGWPVEQFCVWYLHPSPWAVFFISLVFTMALGALSWYLVEKPMMKLKRKHLAALPE